MVLAEMQSGDPGQLFPARPMCLKLHIPFDATAKALQRLCHVGILRSVQGKYGGYQIARELKQLSLGELSEVVMGPNALTPCLAPGQACELSPSCTIRRAMAQLNQSIDQLLQDTSVADLID
jgi:Rrf2 family cysteine metabolism transcriptional repressor